jgi:magnesium transporter
LVVSLTLFCTVIIAKIIGGILPLLASKVRLDPAIMASPLITTIVDALALIIYFSLASMILGL